MEIQAFIPEQPEEGPYTVLSEIKRGYLEGWLSKEDILDAFQRGRITYKDYQWIIGEEIKSTDV